MKHSSTIIKLFVIMLFCSMAAMAQTPGNVKQFNKDGLSFDYPSNWTLTESSNADAQQITLAANGIEAQIIMFVHRGKVDTPEKMAQARTTIVDPYLNATDKQFVEMGAKPTRTPANTEIGGAKADGVRIMAVLDNDPGEAAVYWATVGNRLVVLTLFGPNRGLKQAQSAWDTVRNSLRVEEKKPAAKSTPK